MTLADVWMYVQLAWVGGQALYWWWMRPTDDDERVWDACLNKEVKG